MEFSLAFPDLPPLPSLLATLSSPQPFESLIPSGGRRRSHYLEAVTWLLQKGLVTQLRVYMTLVATPEIKRAAYEKAEERQRRRRTSRQSDFSQEGDDYDEDDDYSEGREEEGRSSGVTPERRRSDSMQRRDGSSGRRKPRRRSTKGTVRGDGTIDREEGGSSGIGSAKQGLSSITISSASASDSRGERSRSDAPSSSSFERDEAGLTRSPLPASFPNNYPYMSAASAAAAARPRTSGLHRNIADEKSPRSAARSARCDGGIFEGVQRDGTPDESEATSRARKVFLAALNAPSIIANPAEPSSEEDLWIREILETSGEKRSGQKRKGTTAAFTR